MAGADRADRMNRLIQFDGIENARELGGIPVGDGRRVKAGCLIRTGMLASVSARDEERLREEFHVTDIVDLRTDVEISQHPDQTPAGMNYHWHPIFHGKVLGISREEEEAEDPVEKRLIYVRSLEGKAHDSMLRLYPMMVSDPYCVEQLAGFFRLLLAHEEGAFLWHWTAGKDRSGVTAALLPEMALDFHLYGRRNANGDTYVLALAKAGMEIAPEPVEALVWGIGTVSPGDTMEEYCQLQQYGVRAEDGKAILLREYLLAGAQSVNQLAEDLFLVLITATDPILYDAANPTTLAILGAAEDVRMRRQPPHMR